MKTQVNLFDRHLLPITQPYNFQRLSLILLGCIVLLVIVSAVIFMQQHQLTTRLKQAEQQLLQEQNELSQFQQLLTQRAPSTELLRQQERLKKDVERHQRLLRLLSAKQSEPQRSFSAVMLHLSEVNAPELWLTEFRLQQRRSEFYGETIQPASVPEWMSRLSDSPYFQGQRFQGLTLQQTDGNEALSFHVVARPGDTL
ncbi:PilN domain-containing protein [Alkalimonas collagenimarina]|uniref:PilN domain-containing protein n=1 Tax=Alkalimonas collagenimarina TaxID=400390 RepID=A0ABT9H368_9GAMM|nr:PilN domain-containing protein [Alkalimonas collagenimarina]MDP4537771.1 PilN domain-containing protein [Alkalimonas collagenimarina]